MKEGGEGRGRRWGLLMVGALLLAMGAFGWQPLDSSTSSTLQPMGSESPPETVVRAEIPSSSSSPSPWSAKAGVRLSTGLEQEPTPVRPGDSRAEAPSVAPGEFVKLFPQSPALVSMPGEIRGVVKLSNPYLGFWRVRIEGTVRLADGTTRELLKPRTLWMMPKQTLEHPVRLQVDPQRFSTGLAQFQAILKDAQGRIIDQASVTFRLTVDFP